MATFDRYSFFRKGIDRKLVPFGEIPRKSSDFYETYRKNKTRLDILSYQYYKSPDYGWLIMQANPELGSLEYAIPDGSEIRIPYPLDESLRQYVESLKEYDENYGID